MNEFVWIIKHTKNNLAIRPKILAWYRHTKNWYKFWISYQKYNQIASLKYKLQSHCLYPCLGEDTLETFIELTYFYQDTWVFKKIINQKLIEHIGLGRYGDSLDPKGSEKAIAELKRVIKKGGNLYISVPIDKENRTFFNAHRAFKEKYLEEMFNPFFIKDKAYIYGNQLFTQKQTGFGIGLYHLSF